MRITWVTRSFLDYRIPLFKALAEMPDVEFTLFSSEEHTPASVRKKAIEALGERAVFLTGEKCFGKPYSPEQRSNSVRRIFWQPGLSKRVWENCPDVVITDAFNHWTLPVLSLRRKYHFKHIVCYERTAHTERNAPWLKRKFIQFVERWVDAVHYNGVLCHDFLRTLGYPEYKLKPGNMTVDVTQLSERCRQVTPEERKTLRTKFGIGEDDNVFLFIGRLIPLKGLKEFLVSWLGWRRQDSVSKIRFLIVGSGSQEGVLKAFCQENYLSDVIFAGQSTYEEIPRYLAIADVFVIPTLEDNWSLVVPEAMACGKPILCSCYNGCHPELVHEGANGWVFDPLNTQNTIDALEKVQSARKDYPRMGESSQQIVKLFSPEEIASSIYYTCKEDIHPQKLPLIPAIIEKFRSFFERCLMKKVHWGCVAHYRKMMRMNGIPNRKVEGEEAYLKKWYRISKNVAKEDYRLFAHYIGAQTDMVPEAVSHNMVEAILDPGRYRAFYSDKNMFDRILPVGMLPKTYLRCIQGVFRDVDYHVIPEECFDLEECISNSLRCVIKPTVDSSSGHGVTIVERRGDGFYGLNGPLKNMRLTHQVLKRYFGSDFIIQEYLEQSEFMKSLCKTSVNTIRLFIYRSVKTEDVVIPAGIVRLGHNGSLVDNSHAGGVSIGVDMQGNLGKYATDQWGKRYTQVNGTDFEHTALQIPEFGCVLAFAKEVGRHLLHHRMANIDVMIDIDGLPRLVEFNLGSMSTWLYQFDSGLAYGEYADEIIEYCRNRSGDAEHVRIEY